MLLLTDYMSHNYLEPDTPGPQYEEIMEIIANTNTNKATSGDVKAIIVKLGSKWCHDIIYKIIW